MKPKIWMCIFCSLLLASTGCNHQSKSSETGEEQAIKLAVADLAGNTFMEGDIIPLNASCSPEYACDCCQGDFTFVDETNFYGSNYCMSEQVFYTGTYTVKDNVLYVHYSGLHVTVEDYHAYSPAETAKVRFTYQKTVNEPATFGFKPSSCQGNLILRSEQTMLSSRSEDVKYFKQSEEGAVDSTLILIRQLHEQTGRPGKP